MRSTTKAFLILIFVVLLSALAFVWDTPVALLEELLGENKILGALLFSLLMFLATVVAPLTAMPLVPLIAPVLGPFVTGLLSVVSWTAGAVVAFLIARHAGRPLLEKFVSLTTIERYEAFIPKNTRFMSIVMLRMLIPVDVLSYALGFLSRVSLLEYTLATALGVSWFSFSFAYLGDAAYEKNYTFFIGIGIASLIVLGLASWYVIQQVRKNKTDS